MTHPWRHPWRFLGNSKTRYVRQLSLDEILDTDTSVYPPDFMDEAGLSPDLSIQRRVLSGYILSANDDRFVYHGTYTWPQDASLPAHSCSDCQ